LGINQKEISEQEEGLGEEGVEICWCYGGVKIAGK